MKKDNTIEKLEKRNREFQLRHEIAKLERSERVRDTSSKVSSKAGSWSWWWVGPISILGLGFVFLAVAANKSAAILPGIALLVPIALKGINRWNK